MTDDREAFVAHLLRDGFTVEEVDEAERTGRLALLPIDRVLRREDARWSARQIADEVGLDIEVLRRLWRALGFADAGDDEVVYRDEDLQAARLTAQFHAAGLGEAPLILISQVLGHGMARLAETLREVVGNALLQAGDTERTLGLRYAEAAEHMVPLLEPLLGYVLQTHLAEQVRGDIVLQTELETGRVEGARHVTVCFADLVGFTRFGESADLSEVTGAGRRLTDAAVDVARPPVRLVKMIGDAAMLVSPEPEPLVEAALTLVGQDTGLPLRAGIAAGTAVAHCGDWLGAPVNLASRVTAVARPGAVLATREVRDAAADRFAWSHAGSRRLKGVREPVSLYRARAATAPPDRGR
ncbi:MAG TPA: adenylate cyclase regulatory domain-containing protein [Solirubrobacteraceae bacterium]|nr:adenylate cyclase regulatory domain-containing protein [Solirubrobacteraceae bacterium]